MRKPLSMLLLLLFLCAQTQTVFSDDEILPDNEPERQHNTNIFVRGLIATGETILTNLVLMTYNVIALRANTWAVPSFNSIYWNFHRDWDWERGDGFIVNQFGHPIQGSFYFITGRINEFNFYQSVLFNAFGSFTWEAFGESGRASMNDFLTTTTASISLGEILFRLYVEARGAGAHPALAALVNPMAGLHYFMTGSQPPDYGRKLYRLQAHLGAGFAATDYSTSENWNENVFTYRNFHGEAGVSVIYGNPFLQESLIPYEHFEIYFHAGVNPGKYLNLRLLTEGYLLSFCPVETEKNMMSTGLSLHFDFTSQGEMSGNYTTIDHYSNALDWSIKYQHLFSENFAFQIKAHLGFTFMGVSVYYSPRRNDHHLNHYGFGTNEKLNIIFDHRKLGRLDLRVMHYIIWTYRNSGMNDPTDGSVNWLFADLTYSLPIIKHLSIGVTGSYAREWGIYGGFPNTRKINREIKLFVAWNM
jgi:hypothetical protein